MILHNLKRFDSATKAKSAEAFEIIMNFVDEYLFNDYRFAFLTNFNSPNMISIMTVYIVLTLQLKSNIILNIKNPK